MLYRVLVDLAASTVQSSAVRQLYHQYAAAAPDRSSASRSARLPRNAARYGTSSYLLRARSRYLLQYYGYSYDDVDLHGIRTAVPTSTLHSKTS